MRRIFALTAAGLLVSCGGVSGEIGQACMAAGREAASPALCSCVQQVANQSLSASDQARAASFFDDPEKAQTIRQSDATRDDAFWTRYRAFADRAEAMCS